MPVKLRYFLSGECSSFSPALTEAPGEARSEVGSAPALDGDLVGQVGGGVFGGVLHRGVDLQEDDALRLKFCRDLADLGPELRQRPGRQRARGVDDDGDRVDALRTDRRQVEPAVDEAPVGQAPAVSRLVASVM